MSSDDLVRESTLGPAADLYNPAIPTAEGVRCPECRRWAVRTWLGGFADEPPGLPHAECRACGWTE